MSEIRAEGDRQVFYVSPVEKKRLLLQDERTYAVTFPDRRSPSAILPRHRYRQGGKVKIRTLAHLTRRKPACLEAFRRVPRGVLDPSVFGGPVRGPSFGALYAVKRPADEWGSAGRWLFHVGRNLGLFLVLARIPEQGLRRSAVRRPKDQAVGEVSGLEAFTEDDSCWAPDDPRVRREEIEGRLYRQTVRRWGGRPAVLVVNDVTSTDWEGRGHQLGVSVYRRDGKRRIPVGLSTDEERGAVGGVGGWRGTGRMRARWVVGSRFSRGGSRWRRRFSSGTVGRAAPDGGGGRRGREETIFAFAG